MTSTLGVGKWLPSDRKKVLKWSRNRLEEFKAKHPVRYAKFQEYFPEAETIDEEVKEFVRNAKRIDEITPILDLHESVKKLVIAMGTEADIGMLIVEMIRQQNNPDALGVRDTIVLLNDLIRTTPRFVAEDEDVQIPCPIGGLLTYTMSTPAGFAAFLKKRVNNLFKRILMDYQKHWLSKPGSTDLLADVKGGWFSPKALSEMPNFDEEFECDPDDPEGHKGFKSFDDFFTRKFREGRRPVAGKDNPNIIVNACENAPFGITHVIKEHDAYWIKSQPYSLSYILDNDPLVEKFVGGTIYQGFLSPHTYHRFHAPVSGKVVSCKNVAGTYFSQPYYTDSEANYIKSQPYLAHVATRGVVIIDTESPLGHVAFVPIGMVEVSTVALSIKVGDDVKKGDNIGEFHFGGSSHVLIFEKGKELAFDLQGVKPDPLGNVFLKVNSKIATFVPPTKE